MAGSKTIAGLVLAAAMTAPVAFMGTASANESPVAEPGALVASGAVQATAACTGPAAISSVTYKVDGVVVTQLTPGLPEGATVEVQFGLVPGCDDLQLGLAAYKASGPVWDPAEAENQVLFIHQTDVFNSGTTNTLSITVPECYFQVDFFTGSVLTSLTASTNYTSQGRLIDAGHGGTGECVETEETTTTTTSSTTTSTTVLPSTTSTSTPPSTVAAEVLGEVVERPEVLGAELAATGVSTGPLTGLGAALTLAGSALTGVAMRLREGRAKQLRK